MASTIATALDNTNPKSPSLHNLALMNVKVVRSQLTSLMGNLIIVLPLTIFIAWSVHKLTGTFLIPVEEIETTHDTVKPHFTNCRRVVVFKWHSIGLFRQHGDLWKHT